MKLPTSPDTLTSVSQESVILTWRRSQSRNVAPVKSAPVKLAPRNAPVRSSSAATAPLSPIGRRPTTGTLVGPWVLGWVVDLQLAGAPVTEAVNEGCLWGAVIGPFGGVGEVDLKDGDVAAGEHVHDRGPDPHRDRFSFFRRPGVDPVPVSSRVADIDLGGEKLLICPRYGPLVQDAVELVPLLALRGRGAGVAHRRAGCRRHESIGQPCPGAVEPAADGTHRRAGDTRDRCVAGA